MSTTPNTENAGTGGYPSTRSSMIAGLQRSADDPSWERLQLRYQNMLRGMARQHGFSDSEADDLLQETLMSVVRSIGSYKRTKGRFTTWLTSIAKRRIIDEFRRRKRTGRLLEPLSEEGSLAEDIADPASLLPAEAESEEWAEEFLRLACARLKSAMRSTTQYQIFEYYIRNGLKVGETANQLGVHAAWVSWVVFRVKPKFRKAAQQVLREMP